MDSIVKLKIQIAGCQSDSDFTQKMTYLKFNIGITIKITILEITHETLTIFQPVVPVTNVLQRWKQLVKYCNFIKLLQACKQGIIYININACNCAGM